MKRYLGKRSSTHLLRERCRRNVHKTRCCRRSTRTWRSSWWRSAVRRHAEHSQPPEATHAGNSRALIHDYLTKNGRGKSKSRP